MKPLIHAILLGAALAATLAWSARADDAAIACAQVEGGGGKVVKIIGPLVLQLESGTAVRLAEVGAPAPDPDHPGTDLTSAALAHLALGRDVELRFDGPQTDRHGRALAQVLIAGAAEPWLQRALVGQGAAFVDTWATNRDCAADLLAAEAAARSARRGLWSNPANRILSSNEAEAGEGRFAIVEGRVVDAAQLRSPQRVYLNFGDDWRTDFTVRIEPAAVRLFKKAGVDPLSLKGATIRVRGYVAWRGGPEIEATNPEQIEVLRAANSE